MDRYDDDDESFQSSVDDGSGDVYDNPLSLSEVTKSYDNTTGPSDSDYMYLYADELFGIDQLFKVPIYPFEHALLGVARPFFILLTILTNAVVVGFFFSMKNRRNASNLLFVSLALSDSMSAIAMLPNSFYIFAGGETKFVSRGWCQFYMLSRLVVARMFHTVSVWQTVLLGIQRHLCVCYPFMSGRICTYWKTMIAIFVIYIVAFFLQFYHVLNDTKAAYGYCSWVPEDPCVDTCIHMWFGVILQQLLPVVILIVLTALMLVSLQKASRRVSDMSLSQPGAMTRSSRDRILTFTAILIVIVFLIPEFPYGIYKVVYTTNLTLGSVMDVRLNRLVYAIYEVVITITFHVNFWIYCGTMSDFRKAVLELFACGRRRNRRRLSRKFSRSSSSRSARTNVSRTNSATSRNRVLTQTMSAISTTSDLYLHPISASIDINDRAEQVTMTTSGGATVTYHPENAVSRKRVRKSYRVNSEGDSSSVAQSSSSVRYLPHALPSKSKSEANIEDKADKDRKDELATEAEAGDCDDVGVDQLTETCDLTNDGAHSGPGTKDKTFDDNDTTTEGLEITTAIHDSDN